ncbi:hypothetical protein PR048_020778 [Dryococelus australis]|uniref:Uncharacterized protein n=1 Tax=Dryococelus australis TaxID=614101 RepID=A0ABQ9GWC3_9NEOP|nr:hypothetical protein PR048_020778 [Dryococelus australis]
MRTYDKEKGRVTRKFRLLFQHSKSTNMYVSNRYNNRIAKSLDVVCYLLMRPCILAFNSFAACYISTIHEKLGMLRCLNYLVYGPLYAVVLVFCLPVGAIGFALWLILCWIWAWRQDQFTFVCLENNTQAYLREKYTVDKQSQDDIYSVCTANVLLASEFLAKLNNIKDSIRRSVHISDRIVEHSGKPVLNTIAYEQGKDTKWIVDGKARCVISQFPRVDFLCLQEVWERCHAMMLIKHLQPEFTYFVYDVGEYSWDINYCLFGKCSFSDHSSE